MKTQTWQLPNNQLGTTEKSTQDMVKPGYRLCKVFTEDMQPVLNENTGRQLVKFFSVNDIRIYTP